MQHETPAERIETSLIRAILSGEYPSGSVLPAERRLAVSLGVTRPTLREVLKQLQRDGWLQIEHGKPTRVRQIWRDGGLNILNALARHGSTLPSESVVHLLDVRGVLAPVYMEAAARKKPAHFRKFLSEAPRVDQSAHLFCEFDWSLHRQMTFASGNPVYALILNGFAGIYRRFALAYFEQEAGRQASRFFYEAMAEALDSGSFDHLPSLCRNAMTESRNLWCRFQERRE